MALKQVKEIGKDERVRTKALRHRKVVCNEGYQLSPIPDLPL